MLHKKIETDTKTFFKRCPSLKADGSLFTAQNMSQFLILACYPVTLRTDINKHQLTLPTVTSW